MTQHVYFALFVATVQIAIAVFAVYSSSQDILSDGACIGGIFGSLVNMGIFVVVAIWAIILAVKSWKQPEIHPGLKPLGIVALSSFIAIFIGLSAGLRCTV